MGIEIPTDYNGTGCNFMTTIAIVEELSKVDPAVAALVDIHNTLVNSIMMKLGTEEQKKKYLPLLATKWVSFRIDVHFRKRILFCDLFLAGQFLFNRTIVG